MVRIGETARMAPSSIETHPMYIGGAWVAAAQSQTITLPYDGTPVGRVYMADAAAVERAITAPGEVGGVMISDIPTFRVDHMPYGGIKQSGMGREGPRCALEEMTELKLTCWKV